MSWGFQEQSWVSEWGRGWSTLAGQAEELISSTNSEESPEGFQTVGGCSGLNYVQP